MREEEGQCLLRIVVSRQGAIEDVQLLESSGSRDLDEEAMRAVRKGSPTARCRPLSTREA